MGCGCDAFCEQPKQQRVLWQVWVFAPRYGHRMHEVLLMLGSQVSFNFPSVKIVRSLRYFTRWQVLCGGKNSGFMTEQ